MARSNPWPTVEARSPRVLGSEAIKWNFTKLLVRRDGGVVEHPAPKDTPESLRHDMEAFSLS